MRLSPSKSIRQLKYTRPVMDPRICQQDLAGHFSPDGKSGAELEDFIADLFAFFLVRVPFASE